jgi:hypothetical protein
LGGAALELILDENEAALELRELLIQIGEAAADIRVKSVEKAHNAHHPQGDVLCEFAILEVLLDGRSDRCRVERHLAVNIQWEKSARNSKPPCDYPNPET